MVAEVAIFGVDGMTVKFMVFTLRGVTFAISFISFLFNSTCNTRISLKDRGLL